MSVGRLPAASVVVAAHDEEGTIGRCLVALQEPMRRLGLEVVVTANGCHDDTASIARTFAGVTVLELPEPSKTAALNAADDVARSFPRIYLDADVVLDATGILSLVQALSTDAALLAAPAVRYDTSHSDIIVRAFYDALKEVRTKAPVLAGRGVYGLSRAGRARFRRFPQVQGDDYFVARLFSPPETVLTSGVATVRAPRSWSDLLRIRTRVAAGNTEVHSTHPEVVAAIDHDVDFSPTTAGTTATLLRLAKREPRRAPGVLVFVLVVLTARLRARWTDTSVWQRDASTR